MLAETMPQALTDATNGQVKHIVRVTTGFERREFPSEIPEPDAQFIDDSLVFIKNVSNYIDAMEEPLSDGNRKFLKDSSIALFALVKRLDEHTEFIRSLPDSVSWKQLRVNKLVDLTNEIEDVAEVCELSVDERFIKMMKGRLQCYFDAKSEN